MAFTRYHSLGGLNSSSVSPESSGSGKAESRASSGFVLPEASLLGVQTAAFPVFSRRQAARGAGGDDTCHQEASSEGGELQALAWSPGIWRPGSDCRHFQYILKPPVCNNQECF